MIDSAVQFSSTSTRLIVYNKYREPRYLINVGNQVMNECFQDNVKEWEKQSKIDNTKLGIKSDYII